MWKSLTKTKTEPAFYITVEKLDAGSPENDSNSIGHKICITNYVKLWTGLFTNESITSIMMDSNKKIQADSQHFLKFGLNMLNNPKDLHKTDCTESNNGSLNVKFIQVGGIVFTMNFILQECGAEEFFDVVTRPLLLIIADQKKRETKLKSQVEGIRGYLKKIPKEILMRYEKQDIADYYNVDTQSPSKLDIIFGNNSDSVDPDHILLRPPYKKPIIKPEPVLSDSSRKTISSNTSVLTIKEEPESQPNESVTKCISNTATTIKQMKEELQIGNNSLSDSNIKGISPKCESENGTTPRKRSIELKTEVNGSSPLSSSQNVTYIRHGVLTPNKKKKKLNY